MKAAAASRQFTGWHMLAIMVAFFAVVIGVNLTLAVLANRTWSGLIVANGYDASQAFNKEEARARTQALLGWTLEATHDKGVVGVTLRSRSGQPLAGLKVEGMLRRPVTAQDDVALAFSEKGGGLYTAPARIAAGQWVLEIDARDAGGRSFIETYRFVARGD